MQSPSIEPLRATDVDTLLPLVAAYWQHDGIAGFDIARVRHSLTELLSTPTLGRGWLARVPQQAAGYLLCTFNYSLEHGGRIAEVDELFVDAPWRGRGTGAALLDAAHQSLRSLGCVGLQMQVADDNTRAKNFYARMGFAEKAGYRLWLKPAQPD